MLASGDATGLADYAANVSSPGNPLYHHYLTVSQFASMFGPSPAAISTVEDALRAEGLTPGPLSANHLMLPVAATAQQFGRAFSTGFDQYRLSSGSTGFANTTAPTVSGSAARYVSTVIGLDDLSAAQPLGLSTDTARLKTTTAASAQVVTGGPQPCTAGVQAASALGAYTADQIASAYNFSGLYQAGDEGSGVTVALLEFEPDQPSEIAAYQGCYGTHATVSYLPVGGGLNTTTEARRGCARHRGHHRASPGGDHRCLPGTELNAPG